MIYLLYIIVLFYNNNVLTGLFCSGVIVGIVFIVSSLPTSTTVRLLWGPTYLGLMLLYCLITKNSPIPDIILHGIQIVTCTLSLLYILLMSEMFFFLQLLLLLIPGNFTMTESLYFGIFNTLCFIFIVFSYEWMIRTTNLQNSMLYRLCICMPIFRCSFHGLLLYMAILIMIHAFIIFQIFMPKQSDTDPENSIMETVDIEDLQNVREPSPQQVVITPTKDIHAVNRTRPSNISVNPVVVPTMMIRPREVSMNHQDTTRRNNVTYAPNVAQNDIENKTVGNYTSLFYSTKA